MPTAVTPAVHLRWMVRRDLEQVLQIDQWGCPDRWDVIDFLSALRRRNCIGMVAEVDGRVAGYFMYLLDPDTLHLLSLAVHCDHTGLGVGGAMLAKLADKLHTHRRQSITCRIPEHNLPAQRLFRRHGWPCVGTVDGLMTFQLTA